MIDLMCLRQSYERREIAEIRWIDENINSADAMTKFKLCNVLISLIDTNSLNLNISEWVERTNEHLWEEHSDKIDWNTLDIFDEHDDDRYRENSSH
jgi:hypothetical protein